MTRRERLRKEMLETQAEIDELSKKLVRMNNSMLKVHPKYDWANYVVINNVPLYVDDIEYDLITDEFIYHFEGYSWIPLLGYYDFKCKESEIETVNVKFTRL